MIAGPVTARTIPELLARAASRDPGAVWLRADDPGAAFAGGGGLTFAAAAGRTGAVAAALREAGVRRGDLVVVTARTTPPYLLCWLALASLGAVSVATNPRSAPAELAGLVRQVSPRALITDAGLADLVGAARRRRAGRRAGFGAAAGRRGRPRRPGRADPDLRDDGQVQAGHADAPDVRDGGGGLPVLDGADRR
jgi:acyl-CoA synthetase (AMP-forming)/AMP-acid ligase II